MKISQKKLIEVLKAIFWPIALIVAIVALKSANLSKLNISWEQFISLLNVVIWPLTILIGLLFFRKNLMSAMGNLGSLNVGPSGLAMTFQEKVDSVKDLIGIGDGASEGQTKSSGKLNVRTASGTPYQQLMELRDVLNSKIVNRAKELNIATENTSSLVLLDELNRVGGITFKKMQAFKALIDLTNQADQKINQAEVDQIKYMVSNLSI